MKHITILVPQCVILASIEGPRQLLAQVNHLLKAQGKAPVFAIQLVGLKSETPVSGGLFTIHADQLLDEIGRTDLIIIPALDGKLTESLAANQAFIPFLTHHYQSGAELASLCTGAFLLAATGLVNNRTCTTNWMAAGEFGQLFPQVQLMPERVLTDEGRIYTSGGAYLYLNLMLYLIEKYTSRELAIRCAKVFAIDIGQITQSPFMLFEGQKEHADEPVKQVQHYIEHHFDEKLTLDELASRFALSRRTLGRRFKQATAYTVVDYLQRVRIEAAKKEFENSRKTIQEVMYTVGYADLKAFRTVFRRITGLPPLDYRARYHKHALDPDRRSLASMA